MISSIVSWGCYLILSQEVDAVDSTLVVGRRLGLVKAGWFGAQVLLGALLFPLHFSAAIGAAIPPVQQYSFVLQLAITAAIAGLEVYSHFVHRQATPALSMQVTANRHRPSTRARASCPRRAGQIRNHSRAVHPCSI